jgi:hypothetical protein
MQARSARPRSPVILPFGLAAVAIAAVVIALVLTSGTGAVTATTSNSASVEPAAFAALPFAITNGAGENINIQRPNILIAWRNSQKILELETRVANTSERPNTVDVSISIVDELGASLWTTPSQRVTLPPHQITNVMFTGTREVNLLVDRLDSQRAKYSMVSRVVASEDPAAASVRAKTFHAATRIAGDDLGYFKFTYRNNGTTPLQGKLAMRQAAPTGWLLQTAPSLGTTVNLAPGDAVTGYATIKAPPAVKPGTQVDLAFSLISSDGKAIVDEREWYVVADSSAPEIVDAKAFVLDAGRVSVRAIGRDALSGIDEASGVQLAYSTDGGITWSTKVLAYEDGNFVDATSFTADIGPFRAGTNLSYVFSIRSAAGNVAMTSVNELVTR